MKTIAFYSYKGGVGRTLAVVHVAYWLSMQGKKVFLLDMDFEAPGLHYKLGLNHVEPVPDKGLVDYIADFRREREAARALEPYVISLVPNEKKMSDMWLMPAGNPLSRNYWRQLNGVEWKSFLYGEGKEGTLLFLELQAHIENAYKPDFLLIDSRTGLTDLTGIGLEVLADDAVVLGVNNPENLDGSRIVLERLREREKLPFKQEKTRLHFVLTRIPVPTNESESEREQNIRKAALKQLNADSGLASGPLVRELNVVHIDPDMAVKERNRFAEKEKEWKQFPIIEDYLSLVEKVTGIDVFDQFLRLWKEYNKAITDEEKQAVALRLVGMETEVSFLEFQRGWLAQEILKDNKAAINAYTRGISMRPDSAVALNNRGTAYNELGEYELAIADYAKAIAIEPEYADVHYNLGNTYSNFGRNDLAVAAYDKALALKPYDEVVLNNRGNAYNKLTQYDLALADLNKAIALKPDYADAYNNRGNAYTSLKKYEFAISDFAKAIELRPNHSEAHYNRGHTYVGLGRYELAIADYDKAIELNPNFAIAYDNRGLAFSRLGNNDQAIFDHSSAIALKPDFVGAFLNRASAYLNLGKHDLAISDYDKAIELNPDLAGAYNNRASSYYRLGNLPQALADVETSLRLDPNIPHTHYTHADIQSALGDTEAFYQALEKAIALDPSVLEHLEPQTVDRHAHEPRFQKLIGK